jgi:hypothetical protein
VAEISPLNGSLVNYFYYGFNDTTPKSVTTYNMVMDDKGHYLLSGTAGPYMDTIISVHPNGTLNWVKSFGGLHSDNGLSYLSPSIDNGLLCGRSILGEELICLHLTAAAGNFFKIDFDGNTCGNISIDLILHPEEVSKSALDADAGISLVDFHPEIIDFTLLRTDKINDTTLMFECANSTLVATKVFILLSNLVFK